MLRLILLSSLLVIEPLVLFSECHLNKSSITLVQVTPLLGSYPNIRQHFKSKLSSIRCGEGHNSPSTPPPFAEPMADIIAVDSCPKVEIGSFLSLAQETEESHFAIISATI